VVVLLDYSFNRSGFGSKTPIIFDDDGSPDGTIALLYCLTNPKLDVKAIIVSYGESYPNVSINKIRSLLLFTGHNRIPTAEGSQSPLFGNNTFPEHYKTLSRDFWGIDGLPTIELNPNTDATSLIVETIKSSKRPITYFVSGSLTSLAQALRKDDEIKKNIEKIVIMGGALNFPGNVAMENKSSQPVAEWNIWLDVAAADEVFRSSVPIFLIPLDSSGQIVWNSKLDIGKLNKNKNIEGTLAQRIHVRNLSIKGLRSGPLWDLAAAVSIANKGVCSFKNISIDVIKKGPEVGRIVILANGSIVSVCDKMNYDLVKEDVLAVFQRTEFSRELIWPQIPLKL